MLGELVQTTAGTRQLAAALVEAADELYQLTQFSQPIDSLTWP